MLWGFSNKQNIANAFLDHHKLKLSKDHALYIKFLEAFKIAMGPLNTPLTFDNVPGVYEGSEPFLYSYTRIPVSRGPFT